MKIKLEREILPDRLKYSYFFINVPINAHSTVLLFILEFDGTTYSGLLHYFVDLLFQAAIFCRKELSAVKLWVKRVMFIPY